MVWKEEEGNCIARELKTGTEGGVEEYTKCTGL